MNRTTLTRRLMAGSVAALAAAGMIGLAAAPAHAATTTSAPASVRTATAESGWVRVGHLSPDTKSVDVKLAALAGGATLFELNDVAYGQVSPYTALAAGTYVVSMVPAGSPASTKAMISATVTVTPGQAETVAAYGPNKSIKTKVFTDDLTGPAAGQSRIRLIQASTRVKSVDVSTTTGIAIARGAKAGSATSYASVPVGPWGISLVAPSVTSAASVSLAPGSVNTLFVLDNAEGGLTIMSVLDSSAAGEAPAGPIETGGGGLRDAGAPGAAEIQTTTTKTATHPDADPLSVVGRFLADVFGKIAVGTR